MCIGCDRSTEELTSAKTELVKIHKVLQDGRSEKDSERAIAVFEAGTQHLAGVWSNFQTVFEQEVKSRQICQQRATQRVTNNLESGTSCADAGQFDSE